jgi:nicotinic acid mononucleotide adenylyltransferase
MKKYSQFLKELPSKTVVFAFGRFNPPTTGHELLVKAVKKLAVANKADHAIYASKSQDAKKNPLTVEKKVHYLQLMFPNTNFVAANPNERTFIEAAKALNKKYKNLIMVAGSDRIPEYERILNTYNGKEFHYDTVQVISAGERDPDADDATGMSASKMRAVATKGDYSQFKKGLPSTMREIDGRRLMNDVRQGMGLDPIKEQLNLVKDELREKYFRGEIFNIGDIVESAGVQYEIVKRGSNHLLLKEQTGKLVSKWIQDVTLAEDISQGYAPTEITFNGYTTKNLHHSEDAAKAFLDTIARHGKNKPAAVMHALMATDTYMGLSDLHLNQGKAPNESEKEQWIKSHEHAKQHLEELGDFLHHRDYWDNHMHEMEDVLSDYKEKGKDELRDSVELEGNMIPEELTDKTLKSQDKIKVARIIATMLGVENAESSANSEMLVNTALRKVRTKALNPESLKILNKMLSLADEVGIKYDASLKPTKLKEEKEEESDEIDTKSTYNAAKDRLRYKDYVKLSKMSHGIVDGADTHTKPGHSMTAPHQDDSDRRQKIQYQTEEVEFEEETTPYWKKSSWIKKMSQVAKQERLAREKKEAEQKKQQVKEDLEEAVKEPTGDLKDACWKGYTAVGMKMKNGKKVPNCVPVKEETDEEQADALVKNTTGTCPACGKAECECDDKPVAKDRSLSKPFDPFFKESAVDMENYEEDWEEHIFADEEPTEEELDHYMNHISDDDLFDLYDDEELSIVDDESGEELEADEDEEEKLEESALMEVLSRLERMKAKMRIRRTKAKRERATKIALKRYSGTATINKRARRLAVKLMKKRLLRGRDPSKISVGEKERVERVIERRKKIIGRLAMRLAPRVRKIEKARMSHKKFTAPAPAVGM